MFEKTFLCSFFPLIKFKITFFYKKNKVPDPRPGSCHNDSGTLPDSTLNFIKTHLLMDENVPAFFGQPILIRTSTT